MIAVEGDHALALKACDVIMRIDSQYSRLVNETFMRKTYMAERRGMVGCAILFKLRERQKAREMLDLVARNRRGFDMTDQSAAPEFFRALRLIVVVRAAAKVGDISATNAVPNILGTKTCDREQGDPSNP
ncbi:hypothetical protein [Roseibium sp. RKSG952]|uniref:hypothetical protein n=1 Tax=Roseibium sp. RKSG952 TaxID=2529384 RepID=UPI0012BB5D02|nr:hypothetical protein [Roseibium sp. RKSG952]MTI02315.1 hypothetical protein [Roseibium sp. RKSG952]